MAKIESIRPGGTLASAFSNYPLAELLIGVLRGNLSGRLDVFLHPEPRNHVFFRNGVPIVVELPDSGASLVQILIRAGALPRERGLDLLRLSEASGRSQVALIQQHNLLSAGALHEAMHRLARAQVVQLFDVGPAEFRFVEGAAPKKEVVATILQPLPIVYQGLVTTKTPDSQTRFFEVHEHHVFRLSGTYPRGVDPFEWGAEVEQAVVQDDDALTTEVLMRRGLAERVASAAIMAAYLAGMMEVQERRRSADARSPVADPRLVDARRAATQDASTKDPSGLVIHRRSPAPANTVEPSLPPPRAMSLEETPMPSSAHDSDYTAVRDRLAPLRSQNYFQLLRVTPGTDPAQLERAYRFMVRRLEEDGDDIAIRAHRDLIADAADVLRDADRAKRYLSLVELAEANATGDRERQAFEAEPKVERAFCAMADDRTGEATFLLSWAEKQDPSRTDVPILFSMIDYLRAPIKKRTSDSTALEQLISEELAERPHDWRVRLCYGLLLAEKNDARGANRQIAHAANPDHPMVRRIAALVRQS